MVALSQRAQELPAATQVRGALSRRFGSRGIAQRLLVPLLALPAWVSVSRCVPSVLAATPDDAVELQASSRRLSTSSKCRQALEAMLTDEHWNFMNHSYTRWCRIKAENEMARCCSLADFAFGRGENCAQNTECATTCHHTNMMDLCSAQFGKACLVDRKLFKDVPLRVSETFCVPTDCDNDSDRESLIAWYGTLYAARLSGWHSNWDDAQLNCQSAAVGALIYTLLALFIVVVLLPIMWILFVAPQERGRVLMTQDEMQAQGEKEGEAMPDLRSAASQGGTLRSGGMGATR
mmetsp:Transcript_109612/g.316929  ORF Transcript_109612/g.316929 Transcript_109612/m.316929 type:complete len:292 (-) Transcript_109612:218-1093(-)